MNLMQNNGTLNSTSNGGCDCDSCEQCRQSSNTDSAISKNSFMTNNQSEENDGSVKLFGQKMCY